MVLAGGKSNPVVKCVKEGCGYSRPYEAPTTDGDGAPGAPDGDGEAEVETKPKGRKTSRPKAGDDASA